MSTLTRLFRDPQPVRKIVRQVIQRAGIGSAKFQYDIGAIYRPNYAYLVYEAAQLASLLGHDRVSVIEFGVAGGVGLLALEQHAAWVERIFPVKIEIYGFDTGEGLPALQDYRDVMYHFQPGFYRMDKEVLEKRLTRAKLVFGNVAETAKTFFEKFDPAPIGAVAHDFDFYSSTMDGLSLFDAPEKYLLPRIFCYFDDVLGEDVELYGDHTGERLAITDFNQSHPSQKLSPIYYLLAGAFQPWHYKMWALHNFSHARYNDFISQKNQQLPING